MTEENPTPVEDVKEVVVDHPAETVEEVAPHPDEPPAESHSHDHLCPDCISKVAEAVSSIASAAPVTPEDIPEPDETPTKLPWTHRKVF